MLALQALLQDMIDHQHLPGMPRIHEDAVTASCLNCGSSALIREGPDAGAIASSRSGRALTANCPGAMANETP